MEPKLKYQNKTNPSYLCLFPIEYVKKIGIFLWNMGRENHIFRENEYIKSFAATFPTDIFKNHCAYCLMTVESFAYTVQTDEDWK